MERKDLDLSGNVSSFFRDVLEEAIKQRGVEATQAAESYLVGLLSDYAKPGQLSDEALSRPLTLLLDEALKTQGQERFERLRNLGDGVLYVSGFFGEHLQTRGVELTYVSALGARAYLSAAAMLRHAETSAEGTGFCDVFGELAQNFSTFVKLLSHIADSMFASTVHLSSTQWLKAYERWLASGSPALASMMAEQGLVPVRGDGTLH